MPDEFDRVLGERLRAARRRRGWSLHEVVAATGFEFKASVLGAYERGERTLSVPRLVRLAGLYGVQPSQLLPGDSDEADVVLNLEALEGADQVVTETIDRYLAGIQRRRKVGGPDLSIRKSDLEMLATLVEADPSTVKRVLTELGRQDEQ